MYIANGVDLQSSEFEELKLLVASEREDGGAERVANKHLHPAGEKYAFSAKYVEIYEGLFNVGLISGTEIDGGFLFRDITQKGFDFIDDYFALASKEEEEKKKQRYHDYKIAAFGVLGGFLSGAFGSWVIDVVCSIISTF